MSGHHSQREPLVVLVGGGIGAGKSCVSAVFAERGFEVVSSDDVGRDVLAPRSPALDAVRSLWPEVVAGEEVDRAALAKIVFSDPKALACLEAITHPEIEHRIRSHLTERETPVAVEVPVMKVFAEEPFTRVAIVADTGTRLARAMRRGASQADVAQRMASQPSGDEWEAWADFVVDNSGAWDATEFAVHILIDELLTDG